MPSEAAGLLLQNASFAYAEGFALRHIDLLVPGGQMTASARP